MATIEAKLKTIVAEQLGIMEDEIKRDSTLVEDLGCDSLDGVELAMTAEEEFEVEFPDDVNWDETKTFGDVVDYVTKKLKEDRAA